MAIDSRRDGRGYRPEIDGLRALAVVPVILFHAGIRVLPGGFLGVDVFFVISGYLITSILLRELQESRFSISRFYERRARRILPALLLVIIVCLPLSLALMLPVELESFSRSVLNALLFVPNVFFFLNSSYFHATAEVLPLLHTWSLGVEEQFYVFFPVFMMFAWRLGRRAVSLLILLVALVSLGLAEWAWRTGHGSAGFYLAPPRAWELMIGCFIATASANRPLHAGLNRAVADFLAAGGLAALAVSLVIIDETTPIPSFNGLLPTVGTGLIIAFARPESIVSRILSLRLLVGLGLISYSAYLWHQPIFAFVRLHEDRTSLDLTLSAELIAITLSLAYLSWRFVETPFRDRTKVPTSRVWRMSLGTAASLGGRRPHWHPNAGFELQVTRAGPAAGRDGRRIQGGKARAGQVSCVEP